MTYSVRKGDSLEMIGARFGTNWRSIARANGIESTKPLSVGKQIRVSTQRIIPSPGAGGIIINIPDRMLYFFRDGKLAMYFPVGLGKLPVAGKRDWSTPTGTFRIMRKEKDPTWHVPESIQREMEEEGKPVLTIVPPGPENPLGRFALQTSIPGILIHETIWPGSVYQFRSHGCIRVTPDHMEEFFGEVEIDTPGEVIYMPVKAAVTRQGRIFLEVHRDAYRKIKDFRAETRAVLENLGVLGKVDWQKVEKLLTEKAGRPEDVTL